MKAVCPLIYQLILSHVDTPLLITFTTTKSPPKRRRERNNVKYEHSNDGCIDFTSLDFRFFRFVLADFVSLTRRPSSEGDRGWPCAAIIRKTPSLDMRNFCHIN